MRNLLTALVLLGSLNLFAQGRIPTLLADAGGKQQAMTLTKVGVQVRILGCLAETEMTLTFANPGDRNLAGTLYFPLPDGATVSGYALDLKGVMVEGVAVEKEKGRVAFEKEVRQGIDPGLVEWTKGNNFKTRVFPIPPRGSRTVAVKYTSAMDGTRYRLPLAFKDKVAEFSLRLQILQGQAQPRDVGGALANVEFVKWQQGFTAETTLKNAVLDRDLVVELPDADRQPVLVEKASDGNYYFLINDLPTPPPVNQPAPAPPKRVTILWDASGSRGASNHAAEFAFLEALLQPGRLWPKEWDETPVLTFDVVVFRNAAEPVRTLQIGPGTEGKLVAALKAIAYDGGTQLAALTPDPKAPVPDFYLLFSDGLGNFGSDAVGEFKAPVYAVSADAVRNSYWLRDLALRTGGEYLALDRLKPAAAADRIGQQQFTYLPTPAPAGKASVEVYPQRPQPVQGRLTLAGRLLADQATVTLTCGTGGQVTYRKEFTVARQAAVASDLLRRYWAQAKVNDLLADERQNEPTIVAVGKEFGLVTPFTSLIVLETLEQYVTHEIPPPKSLPAMRQQYEVRMATRQQQQADVRKKNIEDVVRLWQDVVAWWEKKFEYPANFKYASAKGGTEALADAGEAAAGDLGAAPAGGEPPAPPPRRLAAAPPPPAPAPALAAPAPALVVEQGLRKAKGEAGPSSEAPAAPAIALKPWNPQTPYLAALKAAPADQRFAVYLAQKRGFGTSPAFYLDCADFFAGEKQPTLALQVLSNVAELELENAAMLRVLAHRLAQLGELDLAVSVFEEILRLRPEEPQSYRDLALVLAQRAAQAPAPATAKADYARALELLATVVTRKWDRFEEIELIALTELNNVFAKANAAGLTAFPVDVRLQKPLAEDLRIVMTWDADLTDMDLWVTEPSGEKVLYSHNRSTIGGRISRDFTQGYGPEEYHVRKAMTGTYKVQANYYGSRAVELSGPVTLQLDIFTNYGRPTAKHRAVTLRLKDAKDAVDVADVEF